MCIDSHCAVYIYHYHAGSIPERTIPDKLYNTCTVFNPDGELIAKYRKVCQLKIKLMMIITCSIHTTQFWNCSVYLRSFEQKWSF